MITESIFACLLWTCTITESVCMVNLLSLCARIHANHVLMHVSIGERDATPCQYVCAVFEPSKLGIVHIQHAVLRAILRTRIEMHAKVFVILLRQIRVHKSSLGTKTTCFRCIQLFRLKMHGDLDVLLIFFVYLKKKRNTVHNSIASRGFHTQ